MDIRKEQALLVITVVGLGLMVFLGGPPAEPSGVMKVKERKLTERPPVRDVLLPPGGPAASARDLFLEPTEERSLPPKDILPPPLLPGVLVAPPLRPGPGPAAFHLLRQDLSKATEHRFGGTGEADKAGSGAGGGTGGDLPKTGNASARVTPPAPPPVAGQGGDAGQKGDGADEPRYRYDLLKRTGDPRPSFGKVLNKDKIRLKLLFDRKLPLNEPLQWEWYEPKTDKRIMQPVTVPQGEIEQFELADTPFNRIGLWEGRLGNNAGDLVEREKLVLWILDLCKRQPQFYPRAEANARAYVQADVAGTRGYELLARTLREAGQLQEELVLYQELGKPDSKHRESPFLERGLASLSERLGLWLDAEEHYERAVRLAPGDPGANRDMARFLMERGRAEQGRKYADAARRTEPAEGPELFDTRATVCEVILACGDLAAAKTELARVRSVAGEADAGRVALLEGAIAYAARDMGNASEAFARANAAGLPSAMATIGQGCGQVFAGKFEEGRATLDAAAHNDPLARHLALAAQGALHDWTRNQAEALSRVQAAAAVDPTDLYVQYLLGRERRLNQQFDEAEAALRETLRQRYDFVEALGELAMVHLDVVQQGTGDIVEHLQAAAQYAAKACEIEEGRGKSAWYQELLGLIHFKRLDFAAARAAFTAAIQWQQSPYARAFLPLLEYRQNHVQDALMALEALLQDNTYPEPYRKYVTDVIAEMKDHRDKVEVSDRFERTEKGNNWDDKKHGNEKITTGLSDGRLRMHGGPFQLAGRPVYWRRGVESGRERFLSSAIELQVLPAHKSRWAGLEINDEQAVTRPGAPSEILFRARVGLFKGGIWCQVQDGPASMGNEPKTQEPIELVGKLAGDKARLQIEVVRVGERGAETWLVFWVDGQQRHRVQVKRWNAVKNLQVDLFVEGDAGDKPDVSFDEFRLIKRRA